MHKKLFEILRINTFLLQFFGHLSRGQFSRENRLEIEELIVSNIDRLLLMKDNLNWDGRYDFVVTQNSRTVEFVEKAKEKLKYPQICKDKEIAEYLHENPKFQIEGIELKDLRKILNIEKMFKNGYMLHDVYHGYPEHFYRFQIDCLDYLNSAVHFYNEAFDFYYHRKKIKNYSELDISKIHFTEQKRIQSQEEVIFRNFREAYINLIFFCESFINSVAYDAFLAGIAKNENDELALKGYKPNKKGFLSIANKLKDYPKIIAGKSNDINVEPFKTYLNDYVNLRNQYLHSSPEKGKIRFGIEDWKTKCDELIDGKCIEFLDQFWKKCYPIKVFPKVIFNQFYANSFKGRPGKMYAED